MVEVDGIGIVFVVWQRPGLGSRIGFPFGPLALTVMVVAVVVPVVMTVVAVVVLLRAQMEMRTEVVSRRFTPAVGVPQAS